MTLTIIICSIIFVVSLISIVWMLIISRRFAGSLKISVIFLLATIITFTIKEVISIYEIYSGINGEIFRSILNLIMTFFIIMAIFFLKKMVDEVDGKLIESKKKK